MNFRDGRTRDADAVQFCVECNAWTGHDQDESGAYCCLSCDGGEQA